MAQIGKKKYDYDLKKFCSKTSIHGLYAFGSQSLANRYHKILSMMLFLVSLSLLLWLSSLNLQEYLRYTVKTNITDDPVNELTFPSITICNKNKFRRSIVGTDEFFVMAISLFYTKNENLLQTSLREVYTVTSHHNNHF